MQKEFLHFLQSHNLILPSQKTLLAVSGGVDSMVMAHLFRESGLEFGIAHCNFQLRGKASDADEQLVQKIATQWKVPFYATRFDTLQQAKKAGISIEMMARQLRYQWFAQLQEEFGYQKIATAHHLNDSLETFLLNLAKGTGIRGLHGIPVKNKDIIRPLSFTTRPQIEEYARQQQIPFREDASNHTTIYQRNLIRQEIIPVLEKINPGLLNNFQQTLHHLRDTETIFLEAIRRYRQKLLKKEQGLVKIDLQHLQSNAAAGTILFELLREYGFHSDQIPDILQAAEHPGKLFYSNTFELLVDRSVLIIRPLAKAAKAPASITIKEIPARIDLGNGQFLTIKQTTVFPQKTSSDTVVVDADQLTFPLVVRYWQTGDRFQPFGMGGKSKKVKDYLRDAKVSRFEKEQVRVVESAGEIVWLAGFRLDERFKIASSSTNSVQLSLIVRQ